jgi:adenylosuccinate synthase
MLARTYMAIRTFPIRVGNIDGHSSGDWYSDQSEISWDRIGVPPELTTVTKRVRRVATFSVDQFFDACHANDPDFIFISHMDYLGEKERQRWLEDIQSYQPHVGLLVGMGPHVEDIYMEKDNAD